MIDRVPWRYKFLRLSAPAASRKIKQVRERGEKSPRGALNSNKAMGGKERYSVQINFMVRGQVGNGQCRTKGYPWLKG